MKRAKDRLTGGHLAVGILIICCLVVPQAWGAKATSLFRTTTTTTDAPESPESDEGPDSDGIRNATANSTGTETTTSKYTGIPQKDYIYDPNLPRELNGYNLSSYPFLSLVPPPEQMSFKCDGLHDGFYADTEFKCQIYHHCLYGVRVDFLCANYTAFDQKTFICHFVSQVDCVNSHKYYSKNDDLYQATTARPVPTTTTTTTPAPPPQPPRAGGRRRPSRRRRPQYDYYDDEYAAEDYYEDERRPYSDGGRSGSRRRNKRPRPTQRRPAYDDDDYEDERYARRPAAEGRNRGETEGRTRGESDEYEDGRSYSRPRKQGGRRPAEEREKPESRPKPMEEDEATTKAKDFIRKSNRPPLTPSTTTESKEEDDDQRENDRPRRPLKSRDDDKEIDGRLSRNRPNRNGADKDEDRYREERPSRERQRDRDDTRERPYRNEERNRNDDRNEDRIEPTAGGALVKPSGGSIFSQPRVAPKIPRPVPSSAKDKFKYVTQAPTTAAPLDEEYYDDYEAEDPKSTSPSQKSSAYSRTRPDMAEREKYKPNQDRTRSNFDEDAPKRLSGASGNLRKRRPDNIQDVKEDRRTLSDDRRQLKDDRRQLNDDRRPVKNDRRPLKDDRRPLDEEEYDDIDEVRPRRPAMNRGREDTRYPSRKRPVKVEEEDDYYDDEEPSRKNSKKNEDRHTISTRDREPEEEVEEIASGKVEEPAQKPFLFKNKETVTTTTSTTTEAATTVKSSKGLVRVVKRPFLPSRGGSPYLPRGLQAVGGRNGDKTTQITTTSTSTTTSTTTTEKPLADYNYENDYDTKQGSNERDPADNYSAEYPQGYQSYEETESPKDASTGGESNLNKQMSYMQSKQKADQTEAANNGANSNYDSIPPSSFEKDTATPSGVTNYRGHVQYEQQTQEQEYNQVNRPEQIEKDAIFKASPQILDPYKPTNKPYTPRIPENISIKQNLADVIENDYDVTLNDALNPTIPNLTPVRNYPSPFGSPDRDYTFARFRNNNNYQDPSNIQQAGSNYQYRNQNLGTNNGKYSAPRRYQGAFAKNDPLVDSSFAASESTGHGISVRTPESYYIQQPKYQPGYTAEETNAGLRSSHHVNYRHVNLGDYYV